MNAEQVMSHMTSISVNTAKTDVSVEIVPVHTVNYGWSGFQQHEGVEVIDTDND